MRNSHAATHNASDRRLCLPYGKSAVPSWVVPGGILDNCLTAAGKVDEVGLLLLESSACLAYTEKDLPPELAGLPLSYHAHFPVDLPDQPAVAVAVCRKIQESTAFLHISQAVLHPLRSLNPAQALTEFFLRWQDAGLDPSFFLLENVDYCDLSMLLPVIRRFNLSICLDLGHMLAYGHTHPARNEELLSRCAMAHLNAPGPPDNVSRHAPLTFLSPEQDEFARTFCRSLPRNITWMLELFSWQDVLSSYPVLLRWLQE